MRKLGVLKHVKRIVRCDNCNNWFEITEATDLIKNETASVCHSFFHCPECNASNVYEFMKKDTLLKFEGDMNE